MNIPTKVSVIVPIYNAGPYLSKCLQSLVNQTLKEIEIILVLDCPTDGSDLIAKSFAAQYPNIILIQNQDNSHIGISRNKGIEKATGEYIGFSDHDDYCSPEMYKELYLAAKNNHADVILSKTKTLVTSDLQSTHEINAQQDITPMTDHSFTKQCYLDLVSASQKNACGLVYSHLYRKQFLNGHNIHFADTRYCTSEDELFNMEVYNCLIEFEGILVNLPKTYYFHLLHQTNTGKTIAYRELKKNITFLENFHAIIKSGTKIPQAQLSQLFAERIIKRLYTSWRYELKYNGAIKAIRNLNLLTDSLRITLKEYHKFYNQRLTICKNCFALFIKLFYA